MYILEEGKAYKKAWCFSAFDVWSQSSWCQNSRREHGWHPGSPFSISHVWVANDCSNVFWWSRGRRILLCQPTPPPASSALSSSLSETFKGATSGRLSTGERQKARYKWWTSWTMVATLFRWPEALGFRTRGAYNFSQSSITSGPNRKFKGPF